MNIDQYLDILAIQAAIESQVRILKDSLYLIEEKLDDLSENTKGMFKKDASNRKKEPDPQS